MKFTATTNNVFFKAPGHCAPVLETLSFVVIFPVPGDFEFLQIFPVLGNIFLYRKTLIFYDLPRVLRNIFLYQETLSFTIFSLYQETLSFSKKFPAPGLSPVLETLRLNEKLCGTGNLV